mgnify:CR=1 FL=1
MIDYVLNSILCRAELIKISSLNSGILERLHKIEQNMIDEQDTSIKQKIKQNALRINFEINSETTETVCSFFIHK